MNFDEVIACLENTGKREDFITRLKNAGKHSSPFLHLQSAMTELKMHHTPRGIYQKTIIQHTLRFSDADDCFQKFRLVCKSWKDAVETIRFNRMVEDEFFYDLDDMIRSQDILLPTSYLRKYLKVFKKLCIPIHLESENEIWHLIVNNMKKLNEIHADSDSVEENIGSYIFQIFQNSNETLRSVFLSKLFIPDIAFPNITKLNLCFGENILLHEFQNCFSKALKNMENLETIELDLDTPGCFPVCQHIGENYGKYCISASMDRFGTDEILNMMPLKILEGIDSLEGGLENKKYISHLQYVQMYIFNSENPMYYGWDKYREIFDQCINLKSIEFGVGWTDKNFVTETLPNLSEANQEIWKERISYFQARGIDLASPNEIRNNQNLRTKLAKEAGVTWRFHFY